MPSSIFSTEQSTQLAIKVPPKFVQVWRLASVSLLSASLPLRPRCRRGVRLRTIRAFALVVATTPAWVVQIKHSPKSLGHRSPAEGTSMQVHAENLRFSKDMEQLGIVPNQSSPLFNSAAVPGVISSRAVISVAARCCRSFGKPSPVRALTNNRGTGTPSTSYSSC